MYMMKEINNERNTRQQKITVNMLT